ncbi:MAG: glycolate oxidase subunit GlcE [Gammaproteobacteria bacterium]
MTADLSDFLQTSVREAAAQGIAINITGGNSKPFYGRVATGKPLDVIGHSGIVSYEPTELVITARAGTKLTQIESLLAAHSQMLAFEPPHFGPNATLGGTIACGISGPRRPYAGAVRDVVLGVKILNGKGEILTFGGQVMKNVAGFDVSRLMVGAMGTLGILLEVSLKVLPRPAAEETLCFEHPPAQAIEQMNRWAGSSLPLSAAAYDGQAIHVRLSGSEAGVRSARSRLGGAADSNSAIFWHALREHEHAFFQGDSCLWRLSVPPATPPLNLPGRWFIDWGGAQRWLKSDAPAYHIQQAATQAGGHATQYSGPQDGGDVFQPLSPALMALHKRIKTAFDPLGMLNPGRLYAQF